MTRSDTAASAVAAVSVAALPFAAEAAIGLYIAVLLAVLWQREPMPPDLELPEREVIDYAAIAEAVRRNPELLGPLGRPDARGGA